jgi:hypothetical protein
MVILASLIGGTAVYLFITSLFARIGERQDTLRRRLETIRGSKSAATAADEERNKPFSQRFFKPIISALAKKTDKRRGAASESNPQSSHKETMRKKMLGQADSRSRQPSMPSSNCSSSAAYRFCLLFSR